MSLPRNLHEAIQADFQRFVDDGIDEGPHLDFKRDIPVNWDARATADLCIDALAFANAGGGDLVYGIEEDGAGKATALTPTAGVNPDETARRMLDILLNNVEPRMPGVQVQPVSCNDGAGYAIAVRVAQSWVGPHRFKGNGHFYVRESIRKRQLDIPEIRGLFLRTEAQAQKLRDFRTERLGRLLSGGSPIRLTEGPLVVVHLVPTQAALGILNIDPLPYTMRGNRQLPILGFGRGVSRINLDGALAVRNVGQDGRTHGYSLLFRNGFFESVYVISTRRGVHHVLPSLGHAQYFVQLLSQFVGELQHLGVADEYSLQWSMLGADKVKLGVDEFRFMLDDHQGLFDRAVVALPDSLVEAGTAGAAAARTTLDLLWQASGFERCFDFNADGQLVEGR